MRRVAFSAPPSPPVVRGEDRPRSPTVGDRIKGLLRKVFDRQAPAPVTRDRRSGSLVTPKEFEDKVREIAERRAKINAYPCSDADRQNMLAQLDLEEGVLFKRAEELPVARHRIAEETEA